jgi:RimJ/RimL family protein N-acetyltransferase
MLLLAPEHHLPATASGLPAISDLGSDPSHAVLLSQARIIGSLGMRKEHTVGYVVRREEWGKGLATEATLGLLAMVWAKQAEWERDAAASPDTEVERPWGVLPKEPREQGAEAREFLSASFNPVNVASGRVMQKAGAVMVDPFEVEDWDQTPEERERDGVKMFTLYQYRFWRPEA